MTDFHARHIAIILRDFSTGGSERIAIRLANRRVQMGPNVSLYCGTTVIAAQLDRPPPSRESVQRATEHHGLDALAISYIALFDRIAR